MKPFLTTTKYTVLCICAVIITACSVPQDNKKPTSLISSDTSWMELSLREKIGQVVCMKYNEDTVMHFGNGSMEVFLNKYPIGSTFIASWNMLEVAPPDSLEALYRSIVYRCSEAAIYPMLFLEDYESGVGGVIPGYTRLITLMGLGATNSKTAAYRYGNVIASEARSIGLNWLLHPVADINTNPFNPVTNVRALTDDSNLAMELLPSQVRAMQKENGVAATAKHFPGDGTDFLNQHFTTTQMKLNFEEWQKQHGKVFQTMIDSGVMTIMPGHISFPAYQKEKHNGEYLPATLSKELMTDLLKGEMGFNGVIVSDALEMSGIANYYESQLETEVASFMAGTDILLWPMLAFIDTVEARVLRGEIPIERVNDAVGRIWNMKKQLGLFDENYQAIQPLSTEQFAKNNADAYEIAKQAITLVSNKNEVVPLPDSTQKVLIVAVTESGDETRFGPLKAALEEFGLKVTLQRNLPYGGEGVDLEAVARDYDKVIFAFYSAPGNPWGTLSVNGQEAFTLWSSNKLPFDKVISVAFGDPYKNLIYNPRIWCRINAYNDDNNSQKAVGEAVIGKITFEGKSPVNYPMPH